MGRTKPTLKRDALYKRVRAGYIDEPLKVDVQQCPVDTKGWKESVYQWIEDFFIHSVQNCYYKRWGFNSDDEDYKTGDIMPTMIIFDFKNTIKVPYLCFMDHVEVRNHVRCLEWETYCDWLAQEFPNTRYKIGNALQKHIHATMNKVASVFHKRHPTWTFITYLRGNGSSVEVTGNDPHVFLEVCDYGRTWHWSF